MFPFSGERFMKTVVFLLTMFCATGALGQIGVSISSQAQPIEFVSHPEHASLQSLAPEQSLLVNSAPTVLRGERPMWEVAGQVKEEVSLGQAAREQRRLHANDKKAPVIWHN